MLLLHARSLEIIISWSGFLEADKSTTTDDGLSTSPPYHQPYRRVSSYPVSRASLMAAPDIHGTVAVIDPRPCFARLKAYAKLRSSYTEGCSSFDICQVLHRSASRSIRGQMICWSVSFGIDHHRPSYPVVKHTHTHARTNIFRRIRSPKMIEVSFCS